MKDNTPTAGFATDLEMVFSSLQVAGDEPCRTPSISAPLSLAFLTDLPSVYSEAARQLPDIYDPPEEDLYALATAFTRWRKVEKARRSLSELFTADLKVAYNDAIRSGGTFREPEENELLVLGGTLQAWRRRTLTRLQNYLRDIPADDPLHCPISLFGTMDYGRLETAHTRTLRWLFDPREGHGFGSALLECLLAEIPEFAAKSCRDIRVTQVDCERRIQNLLGHDLGRVDILAEGTCQEAGGLSSWMLLIEAKVDSGEGMKQLDRYEEWLQASGYGRSVYRVFLTPDARASETGEDDWNTLSFLDLACQFRGRFAELSNRPGYHFLRFYVTGILKDVCRWSIPFKDVESCTDPYGYVQYLQIVHRPNQREPHHGDARQVPDLLPEVPGRNATAL